MKGTTEEIRNFSIIAHIDHGKSTLADRFLEITGTVEKRKMRAQVLDAMDLEREKGITIKLTPVRMDWAGGRLQDHGVGPSPPVPYILNLIDTPGHVDFSYEVSRSLAAVEGAVLLVDATQGIQAQTLANLDLARQAGLTIIPVVNKIDLPNADQGSVRAELRALLGDGGPPILAVSAKTGEGIPDLLAALVRYVRPPSGEAQAPLRALVFDSQFDPYKGVVVFVRVVDGSVHRNASLVFAASKSEITAVDVGVFRPEASSLDLVSAGNIGYVATGLRDVSLARVGDTLLERLPSRRARPLPGYTVPPPNVYAGMYPRTGETFPALREALGKLRLSDASLRAELEQSPALGQGFRCGFLGLLHVDIVRERLKREHGVEVILTVPSVAFRFVLTSGAERIVRSAAEYPDPSSIREMREPWVTVRVLGRARDLGSIHQLLAERGATSPTTESLAPARLAVVAEAPLREIIGDFHDDLKAATSGYGSFAVEPLEERPVNLAKISILVNHELVEALSVLVPVSRAAAEGRRIAERLKTVIPRHLFAVPVQAALGGKIIARETIQALRKDVTGHLYGGDVTRKRKLLEKQKKGKKHLASVGSVTIPPQAYLAVLKRS